MATEIFHNNDITFEYGKQPTVVSRAKVKFHDITTHYWSKTSKTLKFYPVCDDGSREPKVPQIHSEWFLGTCSGQSCGKL